MEEASVDLIVADLPYGMTDSPWDTPLSLPDLWRAWVRLLQPNGVVLAFGSQPFTSTLVVSNPKAFKHEWIWRKNAGSNFGAVKYQPMKEHESVLVFCWGRCPYEPIMEERAPSGLARVQSGVVNYNTKAQPYADGKLAGDRGHSSKRPDERYPSSVQPFKRERGRHPNQKPVPLIEYLLRSYTEPGALILDPCFGSGSSLVAATNLGRRVIGIEKEEGYCREAEEWLAQAALGGGQLTL